MNKELQFLLYTTPQEDVKMRLRWKNLLQV